MRKAPNSPKIFVLKVAIICFFLAIISELDFMNITFKDVRSLSGDTPRSVPVFYNVYAHPEKTDLASDIVEEQMSQLLPEHKVFVRSIGVPVDVVAPDVTVIQHDEEGDEAGTLQLLWKYCKNRTDDTVVYIHNKGSFHPSYTNTLFRRFNTRGALSEECMNMPSSCNVCSSRMSPLPHPHTSGNMWVAKCEYVQKLVDPMELPVKMDAIFPPLDYTIEWCVGRDRFAAEHWIHSHPSVQPCDLSTSTKYTWGYLDIPEGDFTKKLELAPRFAKKKYDHHNCLQNGVVGARLVEYKALYNETPEDSWWGWDFYKTKSVVKVSS